ncbi:MULTISPECIES: VOC family protein [unclassified Chelatococcus]|jgi:catechol 2,3-dioxygenase-like lactoylglutathione lyase family enzyme|uniref:VOC family protein n=1 Tax=unclassified Chelatococcus TaxID=2638111 RepID=UPI001BCD5984|nr:MULTISPECIES: VOC family protein [unclassified Chelatococcus]CAH1648783.1 Lactoylglutathione lyase [Hyphomicrobiales bacterium]MBS7739503.1 VOC family protein [Chelatococcus sp. HY11]MBX3543872.1 VOC family protein [Chelatococcus sp.]MCO5075960.1 VOC family protein [Chelatococcus sp.]CAH1668071.1 Lactoylglutathione lyase [Hyphomicrobiales bacterium]
MTTSPTPLAPKVNLITLGVSDIARSTTFYQRLGWRRSEEASTQDVSFFALDNLVLAVWSRDRLAEDAGLAPTPPGFGGFTLAQNLPSERDVDLAVENAVAAGGRLLKKPAKTFWGGYSGYFADPDGHPWEIAYNPYFPLDENGLVALPA